MLRPLFDFDWFGLPIYFIMFLIGIWVGLKTLRKHQNGKIHGKFFLLLSILLSLFIASFFSWFLHPGVFHIPMPQRIPFGGMFFFAGMLTFFGSSALFRIKSIDRANWLHEIVPAFILFSIFERIGASLAGYSFGIETGMGEGLLYLFPARELEAAVLLIMFFVFVYIVKKHRVPLYLLCYSILRFGLEFFRGDDRGRLFITWLSPTQIFALLTLIGVLAWLLVPKFFPDQFKKLYERIFKREFVEKEPFVYTSRETHDPLKGKRVRTIAKIGIAVLLVFAWLNPLNINGLRFMNVWMSEFIGSFGGERSVVTVIAENSISMETIIRDETLVDDIFDALLLIESHDGFDGTFTLTDFIQNENGTTTAHFSQTHFGIPIYGAGKQLIIDEHGYAQKIVGMSQFGFEGVDFPYYLLAPHEAEELFESLFSEIILRDYSISPFWYYLPENNGIQAFRLVYIFSLNFGNSFLEIVMDAETGSIIDALTINESSIAVHNSTVTRVSLNDSPTLIRGNISRPEARDVVIVDFDDGIPQRHTFQSDSPIVVTVTNNRGDVRAIHHVFGEQSIDLQPTYGDEQFIIFVQSVGGARQTPQQTTVLASSIFPFGGTSRMVDDAIVAFTATYTIESTPINGRNTLSPDSRNLVNEAVVHFNNSNGHAFLGLYRFDNSTFAQVKS